MPIASPPSVTASRGRPGGSSPSRARPTRACPPMPSSRAGTRSASSVARPARRRYGLTVAISAPRTGFRRASRRGLLGEPRGPLPGVLEAVRGDRLLEAVLHVAGQVLHRRAGRLDELGELDAGDVLGDAPEHRDVPV